MMMMDLSSIIFAPGEECEGSAFGSVCLSVCLFVSLCAHNSKTIAQIDFIFYTRRIIPVGQVSSKKTLIRMDSIIY